MALVSMKMSSEEAKEYNECGPSGSAPEYPYGLQISLDEEGLAKLGMSTPPAVGTELRITAKVTVVSASQYQRQGGDAEASSSWQITDMEVGGAQQTTSAAESLYGGNND